MIRDLLERPLGRRTERVLLGLLVLILMVRLDAVVMDGSPQRGDAMQNVAFAHRLVTGGTITHEDGNPSMYREPLPIWAIAQQIRWDPRLDGVDLATLREGGPAMRALKQGNLLWAALLLFGVATQLAMLLPTRHRRVGVVAGVLLVHAMLNETVAGFHVTELHTAALLVWAGIAALRTVETRSFLPALALGLLLGLAALVKSSVLYVGLVFLVVLLVSMLAGRVADLRRILALTLVAAVAAGAVVGPWMARNQALFGTTQLSDRGGLSLWYRAIYEQATPEEIRGSWYYFTPGPAMPVVGRLLGFEAADLDGRLRRVHRFHPDEDAERLSFYSLARNDRRDRAFELRATGRYTIPETTLIADQELFARGLEVLRRDPWLFIRTTPLFLWRGTWQVLRAPLIPVPVLGVLSLLGMVALLAAAFSSLLPPRPRRFAVVGLPAGIVAFSALLTMYEPRFTHPALPTMLMLLVLAGSRALAHREGRRVEVAT